MRFLAIDPQLQHVRAIEAPDLTEARVLAGLKGDIDHGGVARLPEGGIAIVVYEYGLLEPPEHTRYFSIGRALYAGIGVLYAHDQPGYTVDLTAEVERVLAPHVRFWSGAQALAAVEAGTLDRPQTTVNGAVLWRWPDPPAPGMRRE